MPSVPRRLHRLLPLAILLVAAATRAHAQPRIAMDAPAWREASRGNGITIYSAAVEGTPIVPFKAVMTIPGTIEEVSAVLEDIPRRPEWISNFGASVLLDRPDDYTQSEYLRVAMPWPVQDRTALLKVSISVEGDGAVATIAAESIERHPGDTLPRHVRAQVYASTFQMRQAGPNVEVATLVFIDPRGRVPAWVVNFFTSRVARSTLEGLRRQVARHLYPPATLAAMRTRIQQYRFWKESR